MVTSGKDTCSLNVEIKTELSEFNRSSRKIAVWQDKGV